MTIAWGVGLRPPAMQTGLPPSSHRCRLAGREDVEHGIVNLVAIAPAKCLIQEAYIHSSSNGRSSSVASRRLPCICSAGQVTLSRPGKPAGAHDLAGFSCLPFPDLGEVLGQVCRSKYPGTCHWHSIRSWAIARKLPDRFLGLKRRRLSGGVIKAARISAPSFSTVAR